MVTVIVFVDRVETKKIPASVKKQGFYKKRIRDYPSLKMMGSV